MKLLLTSEILLRSTMATRTESEASYRYFPSWDDVPQAKVLAFTAERIHARDSSAKITAIVDPPPQIEKTRRHFLEKLFVAHGIEVVTIGAVEDFASDFPDNSRSIWIRPTRNSSGAQMQVHRRRAFPPHRCSEMWIVRERLFDL